MSDWDIHDYLPPAPTEPAGAESTGEVLDPSQDDEAWESDAPTTLYPDAVAWVERWLVPSFVRDQPSHFAWCPQWWEHPEAAVRLHALWRGFEAARCGEGSEFSSWIIYHLDVHLPAIRNAVTGPFKGCKNEEHRAEHNDTAVDVARPPEGLSEFYR